jgi:hypothetical protein
MNHNKIENFKNAKKRIRLTRDEASCKTPTNYSYNKCIADRLDNKVCQERIKHVFNKCMAERICPNYKIKSDCKNTNKKYTCSWKDNQCSG